MLYDEPRKVDFVRGDSTGMRIPAHAKALEEAGAPFLTAAFRAQGSLPATVRVARVTALEPCLVGSTGQKLFLSVEYDDAAADLPRDFFVKFSRDFGSGFRDRRRRELESEIRLGELSRLPGFPIRVPVPYFGDFERASGTGMLIARRIFFGTGGIEPLHAKCLDQDLDRPLDHYRAIVTALARLAAAHKAGRLSPQVEESFPFDAEAASLDDPIPYSEAQLRECVARYAAFAAAAPQLLPAHLTTRAFIAAFERDAVAILRHERAIKRHLHADRDFVALSHFNANIDNGWFWRNASGVLECGLFDWQRARQMNVAYALWGGLCGADLEVWDRHLDELLGVFVAEFHAGGGPRLDPAELRVHLGLYAATMGLAGLIEMPQLVGKNLPEALHANGPRDPVFRRSESARSFLHIFTSMLNLWHRDDVGSRLETIVRAAA